MQKWPLLQTESPEHSVQKPGLMQLSFKHVLKAADYFSIVLRLTVYALLILRQWKSWVMDKTC